MYQYGSKVTACFDISKHFVKLFLKKVKIFFDPKPTKR